MENATPLPPIEGEAKSPINKVLGVFLGLLLVILVVVTAVYVSGAMNPPVQPVRPQTVVPTVSPTPADEEEAAESIDTGDVEKDLQDVQKDVNAL